MRLNLPKEWYEQAIARESNSEVGAGSIRQIRPKHWILIYLLFAVMPFAFGWLAGLLLF